MLKIKVSYATGSVSLAPQQAPLGLAPHGEVAIYGIDGVPRGTDPAAVARLANGTTLLRREPWIVNLAELGMGAIVR